MLAQFSSLDHDACRKILGRMERSPMVLVDELPDERLKLFYRGRCVSHRA